jgi:hypothetical protein
MKTRLALVSSLVFVLGSFVWLMIYESRNASVYQDEDQTGDVRLIPHY